MTSSILDLSITNFCPDRTASSHDVRPLKPFPATPTARRIQASENQTAKDHASFCPASQRAIPAREPTGTNYAKDINNNGNGLASPSITPPSAYNNNQPSRTRPNPPSPSPYGRHQHEAYTVPNSFGAPPISPCASVTHPSTASTIDYLLRSAASPAPCSRHSSSSPSPSPSLSAGSSPSPSPPPPGRLHFPSHLDLSTSASAFASLLSPAEQTALTSLFTLRTSTFTPTPAFATNRSHSHPHPHPRSHPRPRPLSPANALSSLPLSHAHKLSCALSLLALRAHCLREEERRYRRLLVARNLCGDEDLYSDAETVVDEEERRGYVEAEKSVRVVGSLEARARGRGMDAVALRQRREKVVKRGGLRAGKGKVERGGEGEREGDAQRDLDEARKRLNVRGRKAIRVPRTGKKGGMVGVEVERRRWTVQALGYRRERRRKRAGTGGRG